MRSPRLHVHLHEAVTSLAVHTGAKTEALGGLGITQPDPGEGKASHPEQTPALLSLPPFS